MRSIIAGTCSLIFVFYFCSSTAAAEEPSAESLLRAAEFTGGVVVYAGSSDPQRLAALGASANTLVQALDKEQAAVTAARKVIITAGNYGRVSVEFYDGKHLPYIDDLINLVLVEGSKTLSDEEILRVLAPRGTALIHQSHATTLKLEPCGVPGWGRYRKPVPAEVDDWTHWLHGPDNNAVSSDRRVGISRHLQWSMPPNWGRHHNLMPSLSALISAKGRIYYIFDEAPVGVKGTGDRWVLICRDAYNGLELWRKPIDRWGWKQWSDKEFGIEMRFKGPHQLYRRVAAVGDTLYVTLGFQAPVSAIDGRTGMILKTYAGTEDTAEILATETALYLTRNVLGEKPGKTVLCVDPASGRILWENKKHKGYTGVTARGDETKRFTDSYLTLGKGALYLLDRDDLIGLNATNGEELWRHPRPAMEKAIFGHSRYNFRNLCTLAYHQDTLVLAQTTPNKANLNKWQQKDVALLALDAPSGKKLWQETGMTLAHFTPPDLFINKGMVWTLEKGTVALLGLELRSGKQKKNFGVKNLLVGHHHRCYRNKATERLYLGGEEGIEYIDFASGELDVQHWMRGSCYYGIMPANGMIYLPTHTCGCHANTMLNGFIALASRPPSSRQTLTDEQRLRKGPAYDDVLREKSDADAWPAFRHDGSRSNYLAAELPNRLKTLWSTAIGGSLTPPVIVNGKVFVSNKDRNEIICLDADSGAIRWRFIADGRVDTPPTYYRGRVHFGTRSGSVYAVSAADGRLAWRFAAGPQELRLMAFDRLESPWPVNGAVLIRDAAIHFVAGRSMHLNGGMFVYTLDAASGQLKKKLHLEADIKTKGETEGAVLPDVLVSSRERIYMRNMWFNPKDITENGSGKYQDYLRPADGGLLDNSWFNASFWTYMNASAQMLCFDNETIFGIAAYKKQNWKSAGHDGYKVGSGYKLSAYQVGNTPLTKGTKSKQKGNSPSRWTQMIPLRAESLLVGNNHIYVSGFPDTTDEKDPWAAFDARKGGRLLVLKKSDGAKVSEMDLPSPPVYDGAAAAYGKLYLSLKDGKLTCLGD